MSERVKITFPLSTESPSGHQSERLWAKPLGEALYEIDNSPFDAYGVSWNDVVTAKVIDGVLTFEKIKKRGGHSTYRIRMPNGATHDDFLAIWLPFETLHCTYEGTGTGRLVYAIDIPPNSDVHVVYKLLEEGEASGDFQFEEGHYCPPKERGCVN